MPTKLSSLPGVNERIEIALLVPEEGSAQWDVAQWDVDRWAQGPDLDWLDVTEYVLRVRTQRGKAAFEARFDVGSMTVTLDNDSGVWNPDVPGLGGERFRPGRLIRYSITAGSLDWIPVFTGIVDSIDEGYATAGATSTSVLSCSEYSSLYAAWNQPELEVAVPQELSSARVSRILDLADYNVERQIEGGFHEVIASTLPGSYWEEIQKAAEAEGGAAYTLGDGTMVFRNREWIPYGNPTPTPDVFVGFGPLVGLEIEDVSALWQSILIRNYAALTSERAGATTQISTNSGSVSVYGTRTTNKGGLQNASDVDVLWLADRIVEIAAWDRLRIPQVSISLRDAADVEEALGIIIGNIARVRVETFGYEYSRFSWVSGIIWDSTSDDLRLRWKLLDLDTSAPSDIGAFSAAFDPDSFFAVPSP